MNFDKVRIKHPDKVLIPSPFISNPIQPIPYQGAHIVEMRQQPFAVGYPGMNMRMGSPPQIMRKSEARPLSPNVKFKYESPHKYVPGHQVFVPISMHQVPGVRQKGPILNTREGSSVSNIEERERNNDEIKMNEGSVSSLQRMESQTKILTVGSNTINNYIYLQDQEFNIKKENDSEQILMELERQKEQSKEKKETEGDADEEGGLPVISDEKILAVEQEPEQENIKNSNFSTSMKNPLIINEENKKTMKTRLKESDKELELMMEEYHSLKYNNNDNNVPRVDSNSSDDSLSTPISTSRVNKSVEQQLQYDKTNENEDSKSNKGIKQDKKDSDSKQTEWGLMKGIRIGGEEEIGSKEDIGKNIDTVIEGIENVKSEVLDDQINFQLSKKSISNSSAPKYSEPKIGISHEEDAEVRDITGKLIGDVSEKEKSELEYSAELEKGWEKDLEIKNLKNQVWLMKLKENELLGTIKRLEKVNKEQQITIFNLSNK